MSDRVYLDWNATAPLRSEARDAMLAAMDVVGNPSSVHAEGRAAKAIVERARGQVAALVGVPAKDVVFTSGATEAAASIFHAVGHFASSDVEHDAVYAYRDATNRLATDGNGRFALDPSFDTDVLGALSTFDVIALQMANSETGVLQDVAAVTSYVRDRAPKNRVLCDAVQAVGKVPVSVPWTGADYTMISAHKLGGPKGAGALIATRGMDSLEIDPMMRGGGQELGRRSGTENVIGIAGFGAACEAAQRDLESGVWDEVEKLRNILETALASQAKDTIFVGKDAPRLPNTSCFATPGWKGETQVMQMDLAGFAVSSGSACSSGKVKVPRVLRAMGLDDRTAEGALRVSLGPTNTEDEVLRFAETWLKHEKRFRQRAA